jgi:branched-chain amino acid transport system permease protein
MQILLQNIANGIALGAIYACLAVGFSLVWGIVNVINLLHGTFIVLGGYLTFFAWRELGVDPLLMLPVIMVVMYFFGYGIQRVFINRVITAPVLITLTLTFGLDMILYNVLVVVFTATPRRVALDLGFVNVGGVFMPMDRLYGMALALLLTGMLWWVLRYSKIGRAIVAVRMDRTAAALMGIRINHIYAVAFGIGALMAGAAGVIFAIAFPITTNMIPLYLGKAFVVCVIGGLGTVPGALAGGLALGLVESFAGSYLGPQHAMTVGFVLLLVLLMVRPTGLVGRRGYE